MKSNIRTMKNWTLRFRQVDRVRFEEVRSGLKSIETRAATAKYRQIQKGDTITFVCGKDRFVKQIVGVCHFATPEAMIKKLPLKKIMPLVTSIEEMKKRYYSYPNYEEKIKEYGILAFELE
ncbi:MAG: hypothetical protein Q8P56_06465 [Candidatus Uhrbacteria bacterium]|nr:hypothetical protein [Candidatus Uhrbacteria bacterium]